jgi:hypothetical protein
MFFRGKVPLFAGSLDHIIETERNGNLGVQHLFDTLRFEHGVTRLNEVW